MQITGESRTQSTTAAWETLERPMVSRLAEQGWSAGVVSLVDSFLPRCTYAFHALGTERRASG